MIEVQLEDGSILEFPEGTDMEIVKQQAIKATENINKQNAPVEKQKLRALAQGLTLGFGDEIEAAVRNPMSALGLSEDEG